MKQKLIKIAFVLSAISILTISNRADAITYLHGDAVVAYEKYEVKSDATDLSGATNHFTGNNIAQKYTLDWGVTNRVNRYQANYYNLSLGYDWLSFDTSETDGSQRNRIQDTVSKFRHAGALGYKSVDESIRFNAFTADNISPEFERNQAFTNDNINSNLSYNLVNNLINHISAPILITSGASFAFDPNKSRSVYLTGFPQMRFDYHETYATSLKSSAHQSDNKTREISVGSLSQGNNWIQYKMRNYIDYLDKNSNSDQQEIQIGLVDSYGRRLWAHITNWIEVSADGRFYRAKEAMSSEAYDLNFMAVTSRSDWQARTFLYYNRTFKSDLGYTVGAQGETARIPVFLRGIYGAETNWFVSINSDHNRNTYSNKFKKSESSSSSSLTFGATTFTRSNFTLSSNVSVTASKDVNGIGRLDLSSAIDSSSTRRFSSKVDLSGSVLWRYADDGNNTPVSQSWSNNIILQAVYRPDHTLKYRLNEDILVGTAAPIAGIPGYNGTKNYLTSRTTAYLEWNPTAIFNNSISSRYSVNLNQDNSSFDSKDAEVLHRISYDLKELYYSMESRFSTIDDIHGSYMMLENVGAFRYRPDRYKDAELRYSYNREMVGSVISSTLDIREKYNYNFFSRKGVIRDIASIGQEFVYVGKDSSGVKMHTSYLSLNGRYSPTDRLSLYGSARYENSASGSSVLYFGAGLSANYKLVSTSLEYSTSKSSLYNKLEKRLSASVRRTF